MQRYDLISLESVGVFQQKGRQPFKPMNVTAFFAALEILMWPFNKDKAQPKAEHPMQEEWDRIPPEQRFPMPIFIEPFLAYWRSLPSMNDVSYTFIVPPTGPGGITRIEEDSSSPEPHFDPRLICDEYR